MVTLPYGRVGYLLDLGDHDVTIVEPPAPGLAPPLVQLVEDALDHPIGRPRLESMVGPTARVTVIVSDATRDEPRGTFLAAIRRRLPEARFTIAIATGTHGPSGIAALGISPDLSAGVDIVDHDGHDDRDLISLGTTRRGTPVRVHRCVVETDLVVATGCIRPHYFAGFGAGAKAIFPGLGGARDVRINHALKSEPGARAGRVDDNPCRLDIEEAVGLVPVPTYLLNGVCAVDRTIQAVVAGDLLTAFRRGASIARPWFTARAAPASVVIASDTLPVTATLYQAAKIAAAAAPLVLPNGVLVLAAECADGTGPLSTVNEAIFRIGVLPRLASNVRLTLLSALPPDVVHQTLLEPISSLAGLLAPQTSILVIPAASQLILEPL